MSKKNPSASQPPSPSSAESSLSKEERKEFNTIEKEINTLETQKSELNTQLSSEPSHTDTYTQLCKRIKTISDALDTKLARWDELAERA